MTLANVHILKMFQYKIVGYIHDLPRHILRTSLAPWILSHWPHLPPKKKVD